MTWFEVNNKDNNQNNDNYFDLLRANWYSLSSTTKDFLEKNPSREWEYISFENGIIYKNKQKYYDIYKSILLENKKEIHQISIEVYKKNILDNFNYLSNLNSKLEKDWYIVYVDKKWQNAFIIKVVSWKKDILLSWKISTWINKWEEYNRELALKHKDRTRETPNIIVETKKSYWLPWARVIPLWGYNIVNWEYFLVKGTIYDTFLAIHWTNKKWKEYLWEKASHWCVRVDDNMITNLDELNKTWLLKYAVIWDGNRKTLPKDVNK